MRLVGSDPAEAPFFLPRREAVVDVSGASAYARLVALFKPIRSIADLPATGSMTRMSEGQAIDFKNGYNSAARPEMAKDMAAFANALGGVILIGTSRDNEPLAYPGLPRAVAESIADGFADAHSRHLSPKPPVIERVLFPAPESSGRVLLAINVHPFADQIVGARVDQNTWRFPVRVGTDTNDLEPAMLPLYSSAARRVMILLNNIKAEDAVRICFRNPRNQTSSVPAYLSARIEDIDVQRNAVTVVLENERAISHRIPIDDIERVWDAGQWWVILVLGHFGGDVRAYHSNPSNTTMRA